MNDDNTKACFSQHIEKCLDSLYGLALRLTRNGADAEDLVAESVAKAWSAFASLENRKSFRPWLFRILHNTFVSDYRKKSVRPVECVYDELSANGDEGDLSTLLLLQSDEFLNWWADPEREVFNSLLGEDIMAAIEGLPDAFRMTVLLVNVEGLSYDEAAEVMGVPSGTVRSRMKRGRTLVQKALWQQAKDAGLIGDDYMKRCNI